jgi:hypothetical protein
MGKATPLPGLQVDETLALFGTQSGPARRALSRFVAEGVGAFEPHEHSGSGMSSFALAGSPPPSSTIQGVTDWRGA